MSTIGIGWRLFAEWCRERLPAGRRALLVGLASAVSVGGSAGWAILPVSREEPSPAERLTEAAAFGLIAGTLLAGILLVVWTRTPARDRPESGFVPKAPAGRYPTTTWGLDEVSKEIAAAYREGREPTSSIVDRATAADAARVLRRIMPRQVVIGIALMLLVVPIGALLTVATASFGHVYGLFTVVWGGGSVVTGLVSLGRTRAAIETEPDPDAVAEARARITKPTPYKRLGTDHPDDYT